MALIELNILSRVFPAQVEHATAYNVILFSSIITFYRYTSSTMTKENGSSLATLKRQK